MTTQFNVRLDQSTLAAIDRLREQLGVSQVDVIRLAVRALARREGVDGPKKESGNNSRKRVDTV